MIAVGMSTSCVYPLGVEDSFRLAAEAGFDGIEVMVTNDPLTQSAKDLLRFSGRYGLPILSIHAPVLLMTQFVWGRDPGTKLERSAVLATDTGATTVVVHPPFRWQRAYATGFLQQIRDLASRHPVELAVENMFPWRVAGRSRMAYSPGWDPVEMDCDAVTLDFSHAALSGRNALSMARFLGPRLRHIHLCDGSSSVDEGRIFDEHLVPGHGTQPVAAVLDYLGAVGWSGSVVAEVNMRKAKDDAERLGILRETVDFARHYGRRDRSRTTA